MSRRNPPIKVHSKDEVNVNIQVLIATMHQTDRSLPEKMNIQSDAIVGNQCDIDRVESFEYNGHHIKWLSFAERGVGLNRNNCLMRATADFCLFADDDMVYIDGYPELVCDAFEKLPKADVIVFNLKEKEAKRYKIQKVHKVGKLNYLRYGTARVAIRLENVKRNGIYFNQCFGGGTEHCHGEDNLFLCECLRKKLKIYAVPVEIAELTEERVSSWDVGYNDKYFRDQGILYKTISRKWWKLLCLQDAIRHRKSYKTSWIKAYRKMTAKQK